MKVTIIICICVALLPPIIQSGHNSYISSVLEGLDKMAENDDDIKNVFKPSQCGFLGKGGFGFTYKGTLIRLRKEIAMKFTVAIAEIAAMKEYEMYTYLNAINREQVEQYGIPAVYYFGKWARFFLMAISLLDTSARSTIGSANQLDGLIMFREFVKVSKYIHGRGIRHDDIKPENMMFRRNNLFIIDYNLANKLEDNSDEGTSRYLPRSAHWHGPRLPIDDWESFLYSMCRVFNVKLNWFNNLQLMKFSKEQSTEKKEFIFSLKQNTDNTMQEIGNIQYDGLRRVFLEFCRHVFAKDLVPVPPYDDVYVIINREINLLCPDETALFSFIRDEDKQRAIAESRTTFNISSINGLSALHNPSYSNVDYNHFDEVFGGDAQAGSSH